MDATECRIDQGWLEEGFHREEHSSPHHFCLDGASFLFFEEVLQLALVEGLRFVAGFRGLGGVPRGHCECVVLDKVCDVSCPLTAPMRMPIPGHSPAQVSWRCACIVEWSTASCSQGCSWTRRSSTWTLRMWCPRQDVHGAFPSSWTYFYGPCVCLQIVCGVWVSPVKYRNLGFFSEMNSCAAPSLYSHLFAVCLLPEVQDDWILLGDDFCKHVSMFYASLGSTVDTRTCVSHRGLWKNSRKILREGGLWILCQSFLGPCTEVQGRQAQGRGGPCRLDKSRVAQTHGS